MVPVPDGKFPVRDGRESQSVRAFSIDRAEVTNAEYARFLIHVERQGNAEFRHPDQPPRKDHTPTHWGDPIFNAPGLPVVGVDWFDAYAFAKWAGKRLPLSLEWEAAGRGAEGRVFPWGDRWERWVANTPDRFLVYEFWGWPTAEWPVWVPSAAARDAFITVSATTPAGAFPRDRSPFGCLDMAGNVEEWVADWFKGVLAHEPMRTDIAEGAAPSDTEGLEARACGIRGGSWLHGGQKRPLSFLTAADPLSRTTARGFRCAK
jgi:formylglycine-generating enzyme required for sulfatase activity